MDANFSNLDESFEDVFQSDHDIHLRAPFRLLDLPPELWSQVCELAVINAKPISVGRQPNICDQVAILKQPAITRTCRLLRQECLPLFYSLNNFEIVHCFAIPCPRRWIGAVGKEARHRMKSIAMHSPCDLAFWRGSFRRAGIDVTVSCEGQIVSRFDWGQPTHVYKIVFE